MPDDNGWRSRITRHAQRSPKKLMANPKNWRSHPPAQRAAMIAVLDDVGWVQDVVVNERTGMLIDGHLRTELAVERGERTIPIVYVDLSPEEEATVLATLDPLAAMATVNSERLESLLRELTPSDDAIRSLLDDLASSADIELHPPPEGLTDPDDVPDVPAEPYVQRGEIYALGEHRVMCGDATVAEDVGRLLGGAAPLLMVTDPPYGVELDQGWRDRVGLVRLGRAQGDSMAGDDRVDWHEAWAASPSDVAYVWHGGLNAGTVAANLLEAGFEVRSQIVWVKPVHTLSRGHYHGKHEPCWYAVRKGSTAHWIGDRSQFSVWEAASPKQIMSGSDEEKFDHPTQKPVECMERPIRNHEGDVYDPFVGSGTTIIAAERAGRRSFTMDIEPRYVQISIERWQQFTGQKAERI